MSGSSGLDEGTLRRLRAIRFLLTDCDGVLTDAGVYYSARGEEMKRFSIRDGMGVERLRTLAGIGTGIVSGESSGSTVRRAAKLEVTDLFLGVKDKTVPIRQLAVRHKLEMSEIAYIGDDVNDLPAMALVGYTACPADALPDVRRAVDYVCRHRGGQGAFRELVELLIAARREDEAARFADSMSAEGGIQ